LYVQVGDRRGGIGKRNEIITQGLLIKGTIMRKKREAIIMYLKGAYRKGHFRK